MLIDQYQKVSTANSELPKEDSEVLLKQTNAGCKINVQPLVEYWQSRNIQKATLKNMTKSNIEDYDKVPKMEKIAWS